MKDPHKIKNAWPEKPPQEVKPDISEWSIEKQRRYFEHLDEKRDLALRIGEIQTPAASPIKEQTPPAPENEPGEQHTEPGQLEFQLKVRDLFNQYKDKEMGAFHFMRQLNKLFTLTPKK